jgi:hypothetical protein
MAATVQIIVFVATTRSPAELATALSALPTALADGGVITFYATAAHGVWAGKFPGNEPCVQISAYVNPLRVLDTRPFVAEMKRLLSIVCQSGTPKFIPMYTTPCTVINALEVP